MVRPTSRGWVVEQMEWWKNRNGEKVGSRFFYRWFASEDAARRAGAPLEPEGVVRDIHEPSYSTAEVARLTGVSYQRIDYWARIGFIRPSVKGTTGSGDPRRYSQANLEAIRLTRQLVDVGVDLSRIVQDRDPRKTLDRLVKALRPLTEPEAMAV